MRIVAGLLTLTLVVSPLGAPIASASHHHSSYGYYGHVSTGEAVLAAVLTAGLVVAAIGLESQAYADLPWGVVDTDVKPTDTQVFVDGGYIGLSGKFDGWPGYLPLEPGAYELEFRRDGFEPFRLKARVLPGQRLVIKKKLRPLGPGAVQPGRPVPPMRPAPPQDSPQAPDTRKPQEPPDKQDDQGSWRWEEPQNRKEPSTRGGQGGAGKTAPPPPQRQEPPVVAPAPEESEPPAAPADPSSVPEATPMTQLKLDITPPDASVYIDGEFYVNARDLEGGERGILLAPGEYKVEVVRPGYKTQSSTVVLGSESRTVKIRLDPQ